MYYARSGGVTGEKQPLRTHLANVARLAGQFAAEAGLPRALGEQAGWLHDVGKYTDEFQRHLHQQDREFVEHAAHGALLAARANAIECAFAVYGHHGGLGARSGIRDLFTRAERTAGLEPADRVAERADMVWGRACEDGVPPNVLPLAGAQASPDIAMELRTRMLLSCLVDADRLDAEAWMSGWLPALRTEVEPLSAGARKKNVLAYIDTLKGLRTESDVTRARDEVLGAAIGASHERPGFFSLTVPTGGGKTLASLAFALSHAEQHRLRRIIFVLPFLSIIEQNAAVIRAAVGEREWGSAVLEHHSNIGTTSANDPEGGELREVRQRLLAENWDAPVVITTTVQFFESLFSNRPSDVRKIHNIAGSVIVFDEAQAFPPEVMRPLTVMLQQLTAEYSCTALLCTATQPALTQDIRGSDRPEPLLPNGAVREIAPDPARLFARLKRTSVRWPGSERTSWSELADEMAREGQALAVLNTKRDARSLYWELNRREQNPLHLSTRMCAAHRLETLATVRRRLNAGERCLVASTQLVEAGVDLDFPAVWRALGPLDSIAQAAGRCNREGQLAGFGKVTVFRPVEEGMPGGAYRRGADVTDGMLATRGAIDIHDPAVFTDFFVRLYNSTDLDGRRVAEARSTLDFPEVAQRFKLIDDATTGVLVPYGDGASWIQRLQSGEPLGRAQARQMQRFMVALYEPELRRAVDAGVVRAQGDAGIYVLTGDYSDTVGLLLPGDDPLMS